LESLTDALIAARLEIAQLSSEYEGLQLLYREQEKKICELKLENARLHEKTEDLQDELSLAQKNHGWLGVLQDTVATLEAVGVPANIALKILDNSEQEKQVPEDVLCLDMSMAGSTR